MTASSPIADLSYRNYDGPLMPANRRWWVIAKTTIGMAMKKRSIWVAMTFSAWYYIAMIFVLYFLDQASQSARPGQPNLMTSFLARLIWKDQFLIGFSFGQIMYLVVALLVGAGAIANDNRSNALLVYLSKPCTKTDYLFGKWMGVFLMLLIVMGIPALMFFAYGAMSYRHEGFFYQDYWLFPKLIVMLVLGAAIHSSLIIGVSSLFNQGRLAGATYAGAYFVSNFFSLLMLVAFMASDPSNNDGGGRHRHHEQMSTVAHNMTGNLSYASIDGLNIAMGKAVLHTDGSAPFGGAQPIVPMPSLLLTLAIVVGVCALSLFVAWTRIRAVEVVG